MKRRHFGTRFEDFLADDGILEECRAAAIKFKIARELARAMSDGESGEPAGQADRVRAAIASAPTDLY